MTRLARASWRGEPVAGISRLSCAGRRSRRPRARPFAATSISTPSRGAPNLFATRLPPTPRDATAFRSIRTPRSPSAAAPPKPWSRRSSPSSIPATRSIVFEPFYENYGPDTILSGATPRFVRLRPPADRGRGLVVRCRRARRRVLESDARHHHQHAEQPDGQGVHARGARDHRARCAPMGRHRRDRRDLRAHRLRRRPRTCRSGRSTAWRIGPSRSTARRRRSASRGGASAGRWRRRTSRRRSARFTTF